MKGTQNMDMITQISRAERYVKNHFFALITSTRSTFIDSCTYVSKYEGGYVIVDFGPSAMGCQYDFFFIGINGLTEVGKALDKPRTAWEQDKLVHYIGSWIEPDKEDAHERVGSSDEAPS